MKQTTKFFLLVLVAATWSTTACKKDDSPQDYLSGASCWKVVKVEATNPKVSTWEDVTTAIIGPCHLDDCLTFNSDKSVITNSGALKCSPSELQESNVGTWEISSDGKTLTMTNTVGGSNLSTIIELSSNKFVTEQDFGADVKLRITRTN